MEGLVTILAKLDKLTFVSYDDNKLFTKEGFEVFYTTKLYHTVEQGNGLRLPSIQLHFRIAFKNKIITSWGCVNATDTALIVDWFIDKQNVINKERRLLEDANEEQGKNLFKML